MCGVTSAVAHSNELDGDVVGIYVCVCDVMIMLIVSVVVYLVKVRVCQMMTRCCRSANK